MTAAPRILLVGAGSMGSLHARVISQSPSADLAMIVDPRPDVGSAVADRYGATWAPSLDTLDGIDGVVIAAATEAHHELAMAVLAQSIPVLVEKPVAASLDQTLEIIDESRLRNVPLMCGLLERFNPAVLTAKAMTEAPVHVSAIRHSPYVPRILTGVSWDLLVHDVDLAVNLLGGEPTEINGSLGYFHPNSVAGAEDVAEVVLGFPAGGLAHISASRIGQRKVRTLTIHDIDKLIEIDLLRRDVTVYRHVSDQAVTDDGRGYRHQTVIEIPELVTAQEPLAAQLDHFVGLIDGTRDAELERASIIPSHRVIDVLKTRA
jgi:predicted dehydrogenase